MERIRRATAVMLLAGSLLLTGCSDSDMRDLAGIARIWAESHGLVDSDGKPDYFTVGMRVMGGSTGDEQADAVIDAGMTVKNFNDAEEKREQAIKEKDLKKLDAAISMRPKEFRYHNDRGAILLEQGKVNEAYDEFDKADALAQQYGKASQVRNLDSRIEAINRIPPPYGNSYNWALHKLGLLEQRYALTNDPLDKKEVDWIKLGLEKNVYTR
ncbi:MAG TPA: hypothetical protein VD969_06975 [Symbiobacteriaceae bacterium]|nr:hypothetical protein [Symbiobacteriaceae bacterium]